MIILAHDGSIYGDWVARYAVRFASGESDRSLLVLHVLDGQVSAEVVEKRFDQLAKECAVSHVDFLPQFLPLSTTVHRSLRMAIPHEQKALLVCGTRVKPRKRFYLTGTVSEKLLRMHQCPVLALRVVQPGLLGHPQDLLLPLAGHASGFRRLWPVFRRLAPALHSIHLFRSLYVNQLRQPYLSPSREQLLRQMGTSYLKAIAAELEELAPTHQATVDQRITISSDWVEDVLVQASRLKIQIMLLGISERSLAHRVFHGVALERVLRETPCDVGIYRGP